MKQFECSTRIRVKGKDSAGRDYFGRGVADLLHGVQEYHSLNLATKHMGMAYSKAWRIIRQAEETLGISLLYRMGKNGSELTPEGERLLNTYEEAEQKASEVVREVFEKHYREEKN
ncbi:MAG: LysR family transcriptional regulator [Clostridiales bacterium]|nr:LysR family transcriptional regulator [Clostridiales bacterium]